MIRREFLQKTLAAIGIIAVPASLLGQDNVESICEKVLDKTEPFKKGDLVIDDEGHVGVIRSFISLEKYPDVVYPEIWDKKYSGWRKSRMVIIEPTCSGRTWAKPESHIELCSDEKILNYFYKKRAEAIAQRGQSKWLYS